MASTEGALKKSIEGGKWMFINTVFQRIIGFASFLVLARLLTPRDFGILTILLIVPNFIILISSTGLETAIIQKKDDSTDYLNPIWTLDVLKSLALFLIIFFSAPLIADFFKMPEILLAARLSGLIILASGTANVAQLFFFKDLDFKKIFIRDTTSSIAYIAIALGLAVYYRSFWPLFWGTVALHLAATISTYFLHEFRPRFSFQFKKLFSLIGYSKWIYAQNMADRVSITIENSLIARMLGATDIGLYTKAKSIASVPMSPFYNIINRVAFPAYAYVQDSYEKIKDGFLKSLDVLFFISIPIAFLFAEAGGRLILILLGEKWIGMDLILKIITAAFAISAFYTSALPIFNAVGKPGIRFWIMLANLASLALLLLILVPVYGLIGAAFAVLLSSALTSFVSVIALAKTVYIGLAGVIKSPLVPLVASLATLAAGRIALKYLEPTGDITFAIFIAFLGILYLAIIAFAGKIFKSGPYATLRLIVSETLSLKTKNL